MTAVKRNLYIEQGATFILAFQWCAQGPPDESGQPTAGDPRDLTDYTIRMEVRQTQHEDVLVSASTTNGKITLGKDPENEGDTPDPTNGWVFLELTDEDTDLIDHATSLYDMEAEAPDGRVYRLLQGTVTTDPNITQDTAEDPIVEP